MIFRHWLTNSKKVTLIVFQLPDGISGNIKLIRMVFLEFIFEIVGMDIPVSVLSPIPGQLGTSGCPLISFFS